LNVAGNISLQNFPFAAIVAGLPPTGSGLAIFQAEKKA